MSKDLENSLSVTVLIALVIALLCSIVVAMDMHFDARQSNDCDEKGVMFGYRARAIGYTCYFEHKGNWLRESDLKYLAQ